MGSLQDVCVLDGGRLEDLRPEAGELMAVVDLHDVELLQNLRVQTHLVVFKLREHLLTKVKAKDVEQALLGDKVALIPLQ